MYQVQTSPSALPMRNSYSPPTASIAAFCHQQLCYLYAYILHLLLLLRFNLQQMFCSRFMLSVLLDFIANDYIAFATLKSYLTLRASPIKCIGISSNVFSLVVDDAAVCLPSKWHQHPDYCYWVRRCCTCRCDGRAADTTFAKFKCIYR